LLARAIVTQEKEPAANLSLEEAIFLENRGVTLRFWSNDESVIIGRAQLARYETDLAYCRENGIAVVRRFTAGGAVYNGPGNINWSVFLAREAEARGLGYVKDPSEIFRRFSRPLLGALREMGVDAELEPPNRIVTPEGKISGMAAYVSKDGLLCHGTLLLDADLERVRRVTSPSKEPLERRYTRSRDMCTVNTGLDAGSLTRAFIRAFEEEAGLRLAEAQPSDAEGAAAGRLLEKYTDPAWNLGDPFEARPGGSGTIGR
jgi:lipoate---protein ligase